MNEHMITLEDIDVDGAIRESAAEADEALHGDRRIDFLRKAGIAGGAVVGGGAVLGAIAPGAMAAAGKGRPPAKFGKGDIGILNFALTLEYLEAAFYNEATSRRVAPSGSQTAVFLKATTDDENAHVKALKKALGKKAVKSPKFNFQGTTGNLTRFQATALVLENTGVHAYSGQALNIKSAKVVKAALSILTVEARHASVIGLILKNSDAGITPDGPFDTPFTAAKVLAGVKATGFITG
ncbi:MAG: hypothetical protein NVSMB25_03300 [Thermoleophilaceae bacterium]